MVKKDIIEPAMTEWKSPIVFASGKDSSLRFRVYYRELGAISVRYSYNLPGMDEFIDLLVEATIFSMLNATSGYWKSQTDMGDRNNSALTTNYCPFLVTWIPFVLHNALVTWNRPEMLSLHPSSFKLAVVYLDDVAFLQNPSTTIWCIWSRFKHC